jgi:hypothetical protein
VREIAARARRVVAQEVDGLAHLADRIGQRLAGFAHATRDQRRGVFLEQRRGAFRALPRASPAQRVPVFLRAQAASMAPSTAAHRPRSRCRLLSVVRRD